MGDQLTGVPASSSSALNNRGLWCMGLKAAQKEITMKTVYKNLFLNFLIIWAIILPLTIK